jgi:hypothetical protein
LLSALTPAGAMATSGKGRPPAKFGAGDIGILNFALILEHLEAAFYNEATANQKRKTFIKDKQTQVFLKTVTVDENAHRRPRLLGTSAEHQVPGDRRRGALDPDDRGPPCVRRRPAAFRQAERTHSRRGVRHALHRQGSAEGGRRHRLPQVGTK